MSIVYQVAVWLVPLVIAIVLHEIAHGLAARALGDRTAEERGRLSFNPLRHIDPVGTIALPLVLAIAHAPIFGWAKPVPVDTRHLPNPRRAMVLVSLAGPLMNLALALVGAIALALFAGSHAEGPVAQFVADLLASFLLVNTFLFVFNLIPLPPFDGGHVVQGLLPGPLARGYAQLGRVALPIMLILLVVLPTLSPRADIVARAIGPIANALTGGLLHLVGAGA